MQTVNMDRDHPASADLLVTECDSEASYFYTRGQNKKSKRVNNCHKKPELEHEKSPGKRRRKVKEKNITNTVETQYDSEASCSLPGRRSKKNFQKTKRRNIRHEGPVQEHEEVPGRSGSDSEEASCSSAGGQRKRNSLKSKRGNICHKKPKPELEGRSGRRSRMGIRNAVNISRIRLHRNAKLCSRYIVNELLGEGGLGIVYSGVRRTDGKKVAIKFASKTQDAEYITLPGNTCKLPIEVALMELASKPNRCPHIIELLEWFDAPNFFVLILEWPEPCIDLLKYCEHIAMSTAVAQLIIQKIAVAASHCLNKGVFHRDIKEENILINPVTLDVKLIDFGCGDLLKEFYEDYSGTVLFAPPEVHNGDCYQAESTTIWGLGILLYSLLCGCVPYRNKLEICKGNLYLPDYLSQSSCRLITWCLEPDPEDRPTLQQFLSHDWF